MALGFSKEECLALVEEVRRGREEDLQFIDPSKIALASHSSTSLSECRAKGRRRERVGQRGGPNAQNNNSSSPVLLGEGGYCKIYEATLLGWDDQEAGKGEETAQIVINQEKGGAQPVVKDFNQIVDVQIALRVVQSDKRKEVLKEFKHIVSIPNHAVKCYGLTVLPTSQFQSESKEGQEKRSNPYLKKPFEKAKAVKEKFCVCMLMELCQHGNMDEFIKKHNDRIPICTRVDLMLRVLNGLMILKHKGIIWRDLKGQNMLVKGFTLKKEKESEKERVLKERRNSTKATTTTATGLSLSLLQHVEQQQEEQISEIDFVLSDWGTSCSVLKDSNRRMTLSGPGTDGYIAPETKGAQYSYQVDMFAFLVWAASLCIDTSLEGVGDGELEYQIAKLKLNINFSRSKAAEEMKVQKVLSRFKNLVREDCLALYETLANGCNWTQPELRWTCEEAYIKMERFKVEASSDAPVDTVMEDARPNSLTAVDDKENHSSLCQGKEKNISPRGGTAASKKKAHLPVLRSRGVAPTRRPLQAVNVK